MTDDELENFLSKKPGAPTNAHEAVVTFFNGLIESGSVKDVEDIRDMLREKYSRDPEFGEVMDLIDAELALRRLSRNSPSGEAPR